MKTHIFQAKFIDKKGPTFFHELKFSTKSSTETTINVYREGPTSLFSSKIQQLQKQQQEERQYGVKQCQKVASNDIFDAFKYLECNFEGSETDKKAMLKELGMEQKINSFYKTRHDHVVNNTVLEGYVCDSKFYYQIIVHLKRSDCYC